MYRWHNASTEPSYKAKKSEIVKINMEYSPHCRSEKQISIRTINNGLPSSLLSMDTAVCEGQAVILNAGVQLSGQQILCNDGSAELVREVYESGFYTAQY